MIKYKNKQRTKLNQIKTLLFLSCFFLLFFFFFPLIFFIFFFFLSLLLFIFFGPTNWSYNSPTILLAFCFFSFYSSFFSFLFSFPTQLNTLFNPDWSLRLVVVSGRAGVELTWRWWLLFVQKMVSDVG